MVSPNNKSVVATCLAALFAFELRRLLGGRAFWALLLILAPLAGYGYVEAVRLFGEASRKCSPERKGRKRNIFCIIFFIPVSKSPRHFP